MEDMTNTNHCVEKLDVEIEVRLGLVLGWCLFLAKFQAGGAYSGGSYKKSVYTLTLILNVRVHGILYPNIGQKGSSARHSIP